MLYFNLEDYFIELDEASLKNLNNFDRNKILEFRDTLNSKETVKEQAQFIKQWRSVNRNRIWDFEIFGIPEDAQLHPNYFKSIQHNQYYKFHKSNLDKYADIGEDNKHKNKFKRFKRILKGLLIFLLIFCILNVFIWISGSITGQFGSTPFKACDPGGGNSDLSSATFTKTMKDDQGIERKLPGNCWDYKDYETYRTDPNHIFYSEDYSLEDTERGKGNFFNEDCVGMDIDTNVDFEINMRWEYCGFCVKDPNHWPNSGGSSYTTFKDQVLAATGEYGCPRGTVDGDYAAWLKKQKILVMNPQNGKACVCMVGDQKNANWGPGLSNRLGGLSNAAVDYLEYNPSDGSIEIEAFFINTDNPDSIEPGPYNGTSFTPSHSSGCGGSSGILADMSDICALAVAFAYEHTADAVGNDGTELYQQLGKEYCPNGAGKILRACASCVSIAVRASGTDPDYPDTAAVASSRAYLESDAGKKKWRKIPDTEEPMPGDICILKSGLGSHIWLFVGHEAIAAVYPDLPEEYNCVKASYNSRTNYSVCESASCARNYVRSKYDAFRFIGTSVKTNALDKAKDSNKKDKKTDKKDK